MSVCGKSAFAVAIGGKADMGCCTANVRFWPKADIIQLGVLRNALKVPLLVS
jgi:hypothetical protein